MPLVTAVSVLPTWAWPVIVGPPVGASFTFSTVTVTSVAALHISRLGKPLRAATLIW